MRWWWMKRLCYCNRKWKTREIKDLLKTIRAMFLLALWSFIGFHVFRSDVRMLPISKKQCESPCKFSELVFQRRYTNSGKDVRNLFNLIQKRQPFPRNFEHIMQNFTFIDATMEKIITNCFKGRMKMAVEKLHQRNEKHIAFVYYSLIGVLIICILLYFSCIVQIIEGRLFVSLTPALWYIISVFYILDDSFELCLNYLNKYCNPNYEYFSEAYFNKFC